MGKVESGWAWGERRDDAMGTHPCLTQFQNLPQEFNVFFVQNFDGLKLLSTRC